jgi:hypothetical protein
MFQPPRRKDSPLGTEKAWRRPLGACDEESNRDPFVKACITQMGGEKEAACECFWKEGARAYGGTDALLKALRDSKNQQLNAMDRERLEKIRRSCGTSQ